MAETEAAGADDAGSGNCLEEAARALLERALTWHRAHPGEQPDVTFPAPGSPTACRFAITRVAPLQGPVTGGTTVILTGQGIDNPTEVLFGTEVAEVTFQGSGQSIEVRLPPADRPGSVDVRLSNRAGEVTAPEPFTYVSDGLGESSATASSSGSPSGETSDSPTPPSSDPVDSSSPGAPAPPS
jgi:hypothetical protein